jgi:adenine-specific DNA-methyltransferase
MGTGLKNLVQWEIDERPSKRLLDRVDTLRRKVNGTISPTLRTKYAQFMTPSSIADFMASLFRVKKASVHVLDPGAGIGSLTAAFVTSMLERKQPPANIHITTYEIDPFLCEYLSETLDMCRQACKRIGITFTCDIHQEDFIAACSSQGIGGFFSEPLEQFDCVILNPPYSKINSQSETRRQLRRVGIETSNLYTAFLALSTRHLRPQGEMVSITPRSFCNGPYFLPFRQYFLGMMSLQRIHVFESRSDAFREDKVLQENIIMHAVKAYKHPDKVIISVSKDSTSRIQQHLVPYSSVINPKDHNLFINLILNDAGDKAARLMSSLPATLSELDLEVSTGRVVDFRAKEYLRSRPSHETVPLIYPAHFYQGRVSWPSKVLRKPNAIAMNSNTRDLLVPQGTYVLVKRFSAKEEKRRIVAAISNVKGFKFIGFENHLNYYHQHGKGIQYNLAVGLCVFLNSTVVDEYFRLFSGHTQVNSMDLRSLRYPSIEQLNELGKAAPDILNDQNCIDRIVNSVLSPVRFLTNDKEKERSLG